MNLAKKRGYIKREEVNMFMMKMNSIQCRIVLWWLFLFSGCFWIHKHCHWPIVYLNDLRSFQFSSLIKLSCKRTIAPLLLAILFLFVMIKNTLNINFNALYSIYYYDFCVFFAIFEMVMWHRNFNNNKLNKIYICMFKPKGSK